jgi:hypothetical protein
MQTVVAPVGASAFDAAPGFANVFGLAIWLTLALVLAREAIWHD